MTDRARELLERALMLLDYSRKESDTLEMEILTFIDEPEVKREALSDEDIDRELIKNDYYSRSFTAGVRFAEHHHGITGGGDE